MHLLLKLSGGLGYHIFIECEFFFVRVHIVQRTEELTAAPKRHLFFIVRWRSCRRFVETCWSLLSLSRKCLEVCEEQNYNLSNVANFAVSTMFDFTVALNKIAFYILSKWPTFFFSKNTKNSSTGIHSHSGETYFYFYFFDWYLLGVVEGGGNGAMREGESGAVFSSHSPKVLACALITGLKKFVVCFNYKLYFQAYKKFLKKPVKCWSQSLSICT